MCRSFTRTPFSFSICMTVWRVMPFRKQSGSGVCTSPSLTKKTLAPVASATIAAMVHHDRVGAALGLGLVLGHGADHVEPARLGEAGDGLRARPLPSRDVELRALHLGVAVVGAPLPDRDRHVHRVARAGDPHVGARAAPDQRADVGVGEPALRQRRRLRRLDLVGRIGCRHLQVLARLQQALGVRPALEDLAAVGPLALEDRAGIVQRVRQHVDLGLAPRHEGAVHPDHPVPVVVCASHGSFPTCFQMLRCGRGSRPFRCADGP